MFTQPFKIQSVQNLLNIPAFSENNQELKFFDQNLNEIQSFSFRQKFGFIKMAYAEDLQQVWLLDESVKTLVQYRFREDQIVNSFPFNIDFEKVRDFLVFKDRVFILNDDSFEVFNLRGEKSFSTDLSNAKRLKRENDAIFIITKNQILKYVDGKISTIFQSQNSKIVDKNSGAYFELTAGKLYLYRLQENLKK